MNRFLLLQLHCINYDTSECIIFLFVLNTYIPCKANSFHFLLNTYIPCIVNSVEPEQMPCSVVSDLGLTVCLCSFHEIQFWPF